MQTRRGPPDSVNRTEINKTNLSTFVLRNSSFGRCNQLIFISNNYPYQLSHHDYNHDLFNNSRIYNTLSRMSVWAPFTFVPLYVLYDITDGFSETKMVQTGTELFVVPALSFYNSR